MRTPEFVFVQNAVRAHYSRAEVQPQFVPPAFEQREFGFGFEGKIDFRHKAFRSQRELIDFFVRDAPLYASYSTGHYTLPAGRPMPRKGFMGADLVFDLDRIYSDEHPDTHNPIACARCLSRAKEDAMRFYEEFLLGDFGFSGAEVEINYSGSKGFHFHVRSDSVQQLSSDARKQLCDYAAGFEISGESMLREQAEGRRKVIEGPSPSSRGWPARVYKNLLNALSSASNGEFATLGFTPKFIKRVGASPDYVKKYSSEGNWTFASDEIVPLRAMIGGFVSKARVELDKPVSFDLARLIRIPETIHGDTGFAARKIAPNEFSDFEPLEDAVVLSAEPVAVVPNFTGEVMLKGGTFGLGEGKRREVPTYAAVLLLRKGKASLAQKE